MWTSLLSGSELMLGGSPVIVSKSHGFPANVVQRV